VRLYAADHYDKPAVPKTRVKGIGRPISVAFSPDGKHVAVGDFDSATVAILRDRDLTPEVFPKIGGLVDTQLKVAWSKDGQYLFAGGYPGNELARHWDNAGSGNFVDISGAHDAVMQFVPLSGQRSLFADGAGFGLIDAAREPKRLQEKGSIDVRTASVIDRLLISRDARTVQVKDNTTCSVLPLRVAPSPSIPARAPHWRR
jgi:DNA-binding beta-propeller fold protein YncE